MNKFRNNLLLLIFALIMSVSIHAQTTNDGSEVIGRRNLTVVIEDAQMEKLGLFGHALMVAVAVLYWLEIKRSEFSSLVGSYVGYEGTARPISEIHYSK